MKKVVLPGLLAGILLLILGMGVNFGAEALFPALAEEYLNSGMFRPWDDPLMSLFILQPFLVAFILAWVWNKSKGLFKGSMWARGAHFGLMYFLVATIPGMFITYISFTISITMILSWTTMGLLNGLVAGWVYAKLNK